MPSSAQISVRAMRADLVTKCIHTSSLSDHLTPQRRSPRSRKTSFGVPQPVALLTGFQGVDRCDEWFCARV